MAKFDGECYIIIYDEDYEEKASTNFSSYEIHDAIRAYSHKYGLR